MVLASAYLGGFWFFVCVLRERRWAAVKLGFPAVALFATLLGVATVVHWEKFSHGHVAFWLWAGLYLTAPFLVAGAWVANTSVSAPPGDDEDRLGVVARWAVGAVGLGALVTGMAMFLSPATMMPIWPWALTPLTCRVVGAIFCLGSAGLGVVRDPRWVTVRLMLQVEVLMVALMGVAAVRARDELLTGRPLTRLMLVGFVAVLVGSGVLWLAHESRSTAAG
jgi:drug/metabolite transporter (DMT)-like permease